MVHPADDFDLNDLPVFLALVEAGSFTAAAARLGCAKARVSLVIRRLEARLGVSLFIRTTRHVSLTQAGERLYRASRPLLEGLEQAVADANAPAAELSGALRISAPSDYSARVLVPAAIAFRKLHPNLRLELRSSDRVADLVTEGIDLAIRVGWLRASTLRATRLGHFEQVLVASPEYFHTAGKPTRPEQLVDHAWVAFSPLASPLTWTFRRGAETRRVQMRAGLATDAVSVLRDLLLESAGISIIASIAVDEELKSGRLVRLLPKWRLDDGGIYAVYPPGRYLSTRAHAFVDFLKWTLAARGEGPIWADSGHVN